MAENKKGYQIKVPVYVSEKMERDNNGAIFPTSNETLIEDAKVLISAYNSNPNITLTSDKRNKTTTIGIKSIDVEDLFFNSDKCLLLKVTAFKTNLIDGYYQSANEEEKEIRFKERDKICSDTYFFILYPLLNIQAENGLKIDVYWHIFIYEDPSKTNDEMARIARLIMSKIMKAPIKNIKSEKMLADIRKYNLISEVEISLSVIADDDEGVPEYIQNYQFSSKLKKEKKIKLSNMSADDAISAFEDESFTNNYSKRQLRFITHNKRVFSVVQEFKDKISLALEDSFNYSIDVSEEDIKNGNIFKTETIKQNVEGIFTRYMSACADGQ